jgi:2-oxoglutarate dehydrogenase E2 component (dihydrolipoamide succinyltransferase)
MAIVDLIMPKMGESIMEATILRWHKKVGDSVKQDETVLDIATDKVDSEVPSTAAGVIKELLYQINDVVPIGSIIAKIETDVTIAAIPTTTVTTPTVTEQPPTVAPTIPTVQPQPEAAPITTVVAAPEVPYTPPPLQVASTTSKSNNRFYSPLVLNIANSEGLSMSELELIPGTGAEGRVSKKDILQYIADKKAGKVPSFVPQQPVYQQPVYQQPIVAPAPITTPAPQPVYVPPVEPMVATPTPVFVPSAPAIAPKEEIVEQAPAVAAKVATVEMLPITEKVEAPAIVAKPAVVVEETIVATTAPIFEAPVTNTIVANIVEPVAMPTVTASTVVEQAVTTPSTEITTPTPQPVGTPTTLPTQQVVVPIQQPNLEAAIPLVTLAEGDKGKFVQPQAAVPTGNVEIIEMDRMRKLIAKHMVDSKHTSPHVTSFAEADVTNMVLWRERVKHDFERREGTKLTFTPMFIDCLVKVMKQYPMVNASVDGDKIIIKKDFNIGMATALPSGNLIVPVIKAANQLNIVGLSNAVNTLANNARNGALKPDDTSGGTFTLTNVGTFGSLMGTPIINQPQVAILAVGAIKKRPVVIEGPNGDTIGIRHMMYLSLSYDHRIVDGSIGASFLTAVAKEFEAWDINRTWYQYL